jgi:hypothetical protein
MTCLCHKDRDYWIFGVPFEGIHILKEKGFIASELLSYVVKLTYRIPNLGRYPVG